MAERKPKIDLKARLGRKSAAPAAGGPAAPSPIGGGVPAPAFGGGGVAAASPTSVPAPPFSSPAPAPGPARGPAAAPSPFAPEPSPFVQAQPEPAPAAPKPQGITVEMSEEVIQAHQGVKKRGMVIAAATAAIGMVLGFGVGTLYQNNQGAQLAVRGAEQLAKQIDDSNIQIGQLSEVLQSASSKLGDGKFPDEELKKLGEINVPFDGNNLVGRGIGRLKPSTVTMLIEYANGAAKANAQKDRIRSLLSHVRKPLETILDEQENPRVHWGVVVQGGPQGPWASMQPLPKAFAVKKGKKKEEEWPDDIEVKDGDKKLKIKRYTKGDPVGSDPEFIPVNPETEGAVCPSDTVIKVRRELNDMREILEGVEIPGQEVAGVRSLGEQLIEVLKRVGTPG